VRHAFLIVVFGLPLLWVGCDSSNSVTAPPSDAGNDAGAEVPDAEEPDAAPLPSSVRCKDAPFNEKEETISIVTMNLRHDIDRWEERFPLIADEIVRLSPDVIGLQEIAIRANQSQKLNELIVARGMPAYNLYEHRKTGFAQVNGEGVGIMTRFPIEESGFGDMIVGGRVIVHTRLRTPGGGQLTVFNTHLHNEGEDDVRLPQAQFSTNYMREYEGCGLSVLTGDMNATEEQGTIQHFLASGLQDTYRFIHGDETKTIGNTVPIVLADGAFTQNPDHRIDFVFSRPVDRFAGRATPLESTVVFKNYGTTGLYPSDHLGVITKLKMKF
jgi:endonuclease/exonuclease/phosphatase family metal-dependent hydrolase